MTLPIQIYLYSPSTYLMLCFISSIAYMFSLSTHLVLCVYLFARTYTSHFVIRFAISFIPCSMVCLIITLRITLLHILLSLSLCVMRSLYQTVFVFSLHCMGCCYIKQLKINSSNIIIIIIALFFTIKNNAF